MKKIAIAVTALLILLSVLMLAACVPSSEACMKKYKNAGYTTLALSANKLELSDEDVDFIYCAERKDSGDYIRIVCFKKKDKATEYNELMILENQENESGYTVEQKGRVILVGTQNAIAIYNNEGGVAEDASETNEE